MLLVMKFRFVAKGMTSSTFSDETVSSQKNRTFKDKAKVVTIGFLYINSMKPTLIRRNSYSFPHPHTDTLSLPHSKSPATLCLFGDASPSIVAVASARPRPCPHLPSQRFRCNHDASAPKRFLRCFAFHSPSNALPFPRRFSFHRRHSLSLPSLSPSFMMIQRQLRCFSS